jgi:cell division protein FtsB
MHRRTEPGPSASAPDDEVEPAAAVAASDPDGAPSLTSPLDGLPIAGITRRRVGWLTAALVSIWIVIAFARQVGDAAAASNRADDMRESNQALSAEVAALERELLTIQKQEYIAQQARGYRLGQPPEQPFRLAPDAPPPGPNAPGSEARRLGAEAERETPLEAWLSLLFGPAD